MKRCIYFLLCFSLAFTMSTGLATNKTYAAGEQVNAWLTTGDQNKLLNREADLFFSADTSPMELTINVDENVTYQEMDGFGASMTDSSAWLLYTQLDEAARNEVMQQLFDRSTGAGFSYVRIPMGASDFTQADTSYTYNDIPEGETDLELSRFSIQYDKAYIIPILKQALAINPDLKFMGSPWSAPAWMKDNGSLYKGKLKPEYYSVYAQYFVKFIEAYEAEGIPIDAVTLQNEPHYEPSNYSGMRMEPEDQAALAKHLGLAFEEAGIDTKIIVWDHNWDEPEYPIEVLNDAEAKSYIDGTAFHGYAGVVENQSLVHDQHPDRGIYFTESSGGEFAPNFGENLVWDVQNLIIGATRNWAKTSLKWNLALDENHGPYIGGCEDCRGVVTVDRTANEVLYNEEYYAFGHASKFVSTGAVRIKSNTFGNGSIETVAFKNPDNSKVLIALNSSKEARSFKVRWGSQSFTTSLPAGAVATYTWDGTPAGDPFITPYSIVQAEDYDAMSGVGTEITSDNGGGQLVGQTNDGDYIAFNHVEFVDGTASVKVRAATRQDASIEFRLDRPDGELVGSVSLSDTGGWQTWKTKSSSIDGVSGVHTLYLVFKGSVNLNWFQFSKDYLQDTLNYLEYNGDFEAGDLSRWNGWSPEGQASAHKVDANEPRTGEYKLSHWLGEAYQQTSYRTVKVPNGTYKASVWLRKGSVIETRFDVKNYGGPNLSVDAGTEYIGSWKELIIDNIHVTNGQVEVGVYSNSPAGEWAAFDDFELKRVTTNAPASPGNEGVPAAPTAVTASIDGGFEAIINWEPSEHAAGYKIYRSITDIPYATVTNDVYLEFAEVSLTSADVTSYRDSGLQGNRTYYYVVTAFNADGQSLVSPSAHIVTASGHDLTAPAAPTQLQAVAGIESVELVWEHSLESDFLKYNIYRNGERLASVDPVTQTQYTASGLTPGLSYEFTITAVDKYGNESPHSSTVSAAPNASGIKLAFENLDFESGTLEGWNEWHPGEQPAANFVDNDSPRGAYKLTHWGPEDYLQSTYRTLQVPNGTYKVQVWVRTGGGQNTFQLEVKNYGGEQLKKDLRSADGGKWTPFSINHVQVTNGQMEIAVFSDAKAGNWAAIDDFEIYSYAPHAPTALIGVGGEGQASLQWAANSEHDFAAYRVYQDGVFLQELTSRTYNVTGLENGQAYDFAVSAVDTDGNESMKSAILTLVPNEVVAFENAGFELGDLTGWSGWDNSGNAQYVDDGDPRTGTYKLTHWGSTDYMQTTYRTIELENGKYQASVWVRTGGGQNALRLEVKQHGGVEQHIDLLSASSSEWTLFVSEPFEVTTGKVEVALYSDATGGNWTGFDDVQLIAAPEEIVEPELPTTYHLYGGVKLNGNEKANTVVELADEEGVILYSVSYGTEAETIYGVMDLKDDQGNIVNDYVYYYFNVPSGTYSIKVSNGIQSDSITVVTREGGVIIDHMYVQQVEEMVLSSPADPNGYAPVVIVEEDKQVISNPVAKDGKIAVTIAKGKKRVLLPANATAIDGKNALSLSAENAQIEIPAEVLEALKALGKTEPLRDAQIAFSMDLVDTEQTKRLMAQAKSKYKANVKAAGEIYEFNLCLLTKDGKELKLIAFIQPIKIRLAVNSEADPDLLGIYYVADDGSLAYVGGQLYNGVMTTEVTHFSKYAVLEYDKTFEDVNVKYWAHDVIKLMAAKHIVAGKSETEFAPKQSITRAEFTALLVRVLGLEAAQKVSFNDVDTSEWYAEAIAAAYEAGIVSGYSADRFSPNAYITREEMAMMLVKAYEVKAGKMVTASTEAGFADFASVHTWARDAVSLAAELGFIQGRGHNLFAPQAEVTRAESAQVVSVLWQL
ncbi:S-layer homology domain-containing protein [Paenibacillus sp. PL2-23]|uniref:S-layer homology domain-containing protein n=1 Tax=Paenibacillus sp. PL2-23 TaxID=2100729 RepID=UPI0030FCAF5F